MTKPLKNLKRNCFKAYGSVVRWFLKPALAPLVKELYDQQVRIVDAMMDQNHYFVDDDGYVREKELVEK